MKAAILLSLTLFGCQPGKTLDPVVVILRDGRVVGFVHACWATWDGARPACLEHGAVIGVMP